MLNMTLDQLKVLGITPENIQTQIDTLNAQHGQLAENVQLTQEAYQSAQNSLLVNEHDLQAWTSVHNQLITTPDATVG